MDTLEEQSIGSLKFPNHKFGELRKVDVALLLIKDVFGELSNTFRVCLCFEDVSLILENGLQFAVICDDTVVDNNEFSFRITPVTSVGEPAESQPVRMAIERSGLAVCCPSGVRNAGMGHELPVHVDVLFIDQLSQGCDLADLFEQVYFIFAVAIDCHSSRVISSIFKTLEPFTHQHLRENTGTPSINTLIRSALDFSTR